MSRKLTHGRVVRGRAPAGRADIALLRAAARDLACGRSQAAVARVVAEIAGKLGRVRAPLKLVIALVVQQRSPVHGILEAFQGCLDVSQLRFQRLEPG